MQYAVALVVRNGVGGLVKKEKKMWVDVARGYRTRKDKCEGTREKEKEICPRE